MWELLGERAILKYRMHLPRFPLDPMILDSGPCQILRPVPVPDTRNLGYLARTRGTAGLSVHRPKLENLGPVISTAALFWGDPAPQFEGSGACRIAGGSGSAAPNRGTEGRKSP